MFLNTMFPECFNVSQPQYYKRVCKFVFCTHKYAQSVTDVRRTAKTHLMHIYGMMPEIILICSYFTFRFQPCYGKIYHLHE